MPTKRPANSTTKRGAYFIFRYASNRGTDTRICVRLPDGTTIAEALERAKEWAESATQGTACRDYVVQCWAVEMPVLREWQRAWKQAVEAKREADAKFADLRAMRSPCDWRDR